MLLKENFPWHYKRNIRVVGYLVARTVKIAIAFSATILFFQSCETNKEQSEELKLFFEKCDELNIVYYSKDTFVFKTIDTSTIYNFTGLITSDNDNNLQSLNARPEEQLIYKSKGEIFFTAYVFNHYNKKGNLSDYVSYILQSKKCKHLLTYRTGMGISEIYEHKFNPQGNPWTNLDTTKFHYEDMKTTAN